MLCKIFFWLRIKTTYPKIFSLRNFKAVFIFDTSNTFINSVHPLAALYISFAFIGNDLSFTMIPSILKEAALLIIEPIFLGSVTSSKATKFIFFLFFYLYKINVFFNSL